MKLKRFSNKRPFVFFSGILLIYTILQLLISYHIIETEFSSTHHQKYNNNNIEDDENDENIIIPEYTSNSFEGCDKLDINYKFGKKRFKNQRIACLILSLFPRNKILMQFIGETYGKFCDGLYFILDNSDSHYFNRTMLKEWNDKNRINIGDKEWNENNDIINEDVKLEHGSSYFGGTIIKLNLTRKSHHLKRNTWEKVHRMYTYFYIYYLNKYDWFIRIDDDVLVSIINLKEYLSYFDVLNNKYYIGHTLLDRWMNDNIIYNAGNLHIINSLTLSYLGPLLLTLPTANEPRQSHAHCMDFIAGNDDPHLGQCLNALSIYPISTLDYDLKNRFMVFRNSDHYNIKKEDSWYWKLRPNDMKSLNKCCNKFALNDHPWIHIKSHLKWRQIFIKMSETKWNNITYLNKLKLNSSKNEIIPPFPCSFMFNLNNKFKIDKYYNIKLDKIPKGQRISFGKNNILNCHKCNIGDKKDIYWNNEWDRTKLIFKINESNKLKFYQISKYFPNKLISTQFDIDINTNKFISSNKSNDNAQFLQGLIDSVLNNNNNNNNKHSLNNP